MFALPEFRKEKPALHDPDGLWVRLADAIVHRLAHGGQILCRVRLGRHLVEGVAVVVVVSVIGAVVVFIMAVVVVVCLLVVIVALVLVVAVAVVVVKVVIVVVIMEVVLVKVDTVEMVVL